MQRTLYLCLCLVVTAFVQQSPLEEAAALEARSDACLNRLQWTEAEDLLRRALEIKQTALGPKHPVTGAVLDRLAQVYILDGQLDRAEPHALEAVAIQRSNPADAGVAGALSTLGNIYLIRREFTRAKPLLDEALRLTAPLENLGRAPIDTLTSLATYYRATGDFARSEPLIRRALWLCDRGLGPDHPYTASTLTNAALLESEQGNTTAAEVHLKRALTIFYRVEKPAGFSTAVAESQLGEIYLVRGRLSEARPLLLHALEIERTLTGARQLQAGTLSALAELNLRQSNRAEAESCYRQSIALFEAAGVSVDHPQYVGTVQRYAQMLRKSRRKPEAKALEVSFRERGGQP